MLNINKIALIKQFMPLNGFLWYIHKLLLKNIYKKSSKPENNFVNEDNVHTIWVDLPEIERRGEL